MYEGLAFDLLEKGPCSVEAEKPRCRWAYRDPMMLRYHDEEWGDPVATDEGHFERLTLEIFQAGLSWWQILHRRQGFREAFANFSIDEVATWGPAEAERLSRDARIIRNGLKIQATLDNARIFKGLQRQYGSYMAYLAQLDQDLPLLFQEFRRRFRFMGPTIAESYLQSVGKIPAPHEDRCWKARVANV